MNCATCKYFMARTDSEGICRRYPPAVLCPINGPTFSVFPPMLAEGYCGEWHPSLVIRSRDGGAETPMEATL